MLSFLAEEMCASALMEALPAIQAPLSLPALNRMLTIRESQFNVLAQSSFESWLMNHVTRFFPDKVREITEDELRAWVRKGYDSARQYFRSEAGISFYLDLACMFGDHFVDDPNLFWAREILTNPALSDDKRRRILYTKARAHLLRLRSQTKSSSHA